MIPFKTSHSGSVKRRLHASPVGRDTFLHFFELPTRWAQSNRLRAQETM